MLLLTHCKNWLVALGVLATGFSASAQCTWNDLSLESFEYTTVIPGLVPGATIHNTPQTFPGNIHHGTRGMYMNFTNGFTGLVFDRQYTDFCIGKDYRFSFWTRDAFNSSNNMTFQVLDENNVVLATQNVVTNNVWQNIILPFTATTATVRFQIINNLAGSPAGNDAGFDELRLQVCTPTPVNLTKAECATGGSFNLFDELTNVSQTGNWTGPSALTNGYQGTFTEGVNTNGSYAYTIDGGAALTCPDSVFNVQVTIYQTPDITTATPVSSCGAYTLPVITGTNLSGNQHYYTGSLGTGTMLATGSNVNTSQTIYIYDGITGCSDEETLAVTITAPFTAGADNSADYCSPGPLIDLNDFISASATGGGNWAETTVPASGTFNIGTGEWATATIPSGVYTFTYSFPASGACPADEATITMNLGTLDVNLGNDTTFCQGSSMYLTPGTGYDSYLWDNGSTNTTRFVTMPGNYWVRVGLMGDNLIVNGDFEQGNTNFTTDYTVGMGGSWGQLSSAGTYAITTSPHLVHNNFAVCQDHTPDPGNKMMVVNGAGTPGTDVWCQTVAVNTNTDYQFRAWAASALNDPNVANLQFTINGAPLGSVFSLSPTACNWQQFYQTWNSGMVTSAQICIVNQNVLDSGNDFAIDDISFAPICYARDTITVANYPQPVITATPNDTICAGEIGTLTASSVTPGLDFTWNPGGLNTAQINVSPTVNTVYSVSAVSPEGCVSNTVNRTIVVNPTPHAFIFINGNDTLCEGMSNNLEAWPTGVPNSTYSWSPGGSTASEIDVVPPVGLTNYTLTVTSPAGCVDDTTVTVLVIPALVVNIETDVPPTICEGQSVSLTAISNQPDMEYNWIPTGSTTNTTTVSSPGWVYVTADYYFCPQAIDSIEVTLLPDPVVSVPGDMEVCPGEPVYVQVSSDQPGSTFVWQPGNLTGSGNTITVGGTTTFTVVAENNGCVSDPQTFTITASAACFLSVPNVFTPNADGDNDYFQLVSYDGIKSLKCSIVNRWGNTIREFDTPDFKWDGTDEGGNLMTEGVYFYTIEAESKANEVFKETGMVQLVK